MQDRIKSTAVQHPVWVWTAAATTFALAALSPTPACTPLVALLTCMRLAAWTFLPRPGGYVFGIMQAFFVALASATMHLAPSLDALSTPNISLVVIGTITFFESCVASAIVFAVCYAVKFTHVPWSQLTLFPALWASAWGFMSSVSPVGQLVTWSPVVGLGPYLWLRSVLGQWGIDWVTAAWAVVFSEVIGSWLVGSSDEFEDSSLDQAPQQPLIDYEEVPTYGSVGNSVGDSIRKSASEGLSPKGRGLVMLSVVLIFLAIPSYTYPFLPLRIDSSSVTPLAVSCIMPQHPGATPSFDDYLLESKRQQAMAATAILLWPESAVSFSSLTDRDSAFARIQEAIGAKKYIGVSFEETLPPEGSHSAAKRNGLALITKTGPPLLQYYKRDLVPIAESFSMIPGTSKPDTFTLEMTPPTGWKKEDWAPGNHTRSIPITTSICLDFASSSSFTSLDSRPALILAPARTWHVAVGYAMWEQAKARAVETGSTIVWCDGGEGGIGGIATRDYSEIVQRGWGTWSKFIPIQYPFDERRTAYTLHGQYAAFAVVWSVVGIGYGVIWGRRAVQLALSRITGGER